MTGGARVAWIEPTAHEATEPASILMGNVPTLWYANETVFRVLCRARWQENSTDVRTYMGC